MHVAGGEKAENATVTFTPKEFMEGDLPPLRRPYFLAIIASNTLATTMVKKANGRVDGFVVEGPPPAATTRRRVEGSAERSGRTGVWRARRGRSGEAQGIGPALLAGRGYGTPEGLREALAAGAAGVQVGTPFALCEESALREDYKRAILASVLAGEMKVFTDPLASPTGFPFKTVPLKGTVAEAEVYAERPRICDLGYLREAYRLPSGGIGYRCAAEPVATYLGEGGAARKRPAASACATRCWPTSAWRRFRPAPMSKRAGHLWRLPDRRGQFPDQRDGLQCRRCDRKLLGTRG